MEWSSWNVNEVMAGPAPICDPRAMQPSGLGKFVGRRRSGSSDAARARGRPAARIASAWIGRDRCKRGDGRSLPVSVGSFFQDLLAQGQIGYCAARPGCAMRPASRKFEKLAEAAGSAARPSLMRCSARPSKPCPCRQEGADESPASLSQRGYRIAK